ncbi:MAG: MXAN_5187 C-terminal domain-containing protein [Polyangiaceae bacterium]
MENAEVEVALEELENRLERLRALYEQYFMGIERIEPQIPRKDVDRRIYVLRREKIRNTAKRFKLQTIISRYNTFQQYWQRICREIENGTYKRHVIRAERIAPGKMLTIAARKRLGKAALDAMGTDAAPEPAPASVAPPSAPPVAESAPLPIPSPVPRPGMPSLLGKAPPKPGARPPPKPGMPGVNAPAPAAVQAAPPTPAAVASPAVPAPPPARAPAPSAFDIDLDFLGDWDPSATPAKPKRAPDVPGQPFGRALNQRLGAAPAPPTAAAPKPALARPATPLAKPLTAAGAPAAGAPLVAPPFVSSRPPPAPLPAGARPALLARLAPAAPSVVVAKPPAPAAPSAPAVAAKPLPAPLGAKALGAPIPAQSATPSAAKPVAPIAIRPPAAPPLAAAKPAAPPAAQPAAPKPAAAPATPPDDRVRELHARLVEAKRQTQDANAVSMEGLAKSMKATEAKLREQHKNRKIDFDIVIKDGKAVLKPIVR